MKDVRIVFIGDSFVNGVGDHELLGWAGRLCRRLAQTGVAVTHYNLGVRRDTSSDIAARWEAEVLARAAMSPRLVFSWGVNDTTIESAHRRVGDDESCRNFDAILGRASQRWPVFFIGPPPVLDPDHSARIAALTEALAARAETMGVGFMTPFTALLNEPSWIEGFTSGDGYHPDSRGYDRLASIIDGDPAWRVWLDA